MGLLNFNNIFRRNGLNFFGSSMITLSCENESLDFPVAPESFGVQVKNNNSVVNITNFGDYNMHGKTGLKTISISSFFPNQEYNFSNGDDNPYENIEKIENWRTSNKVLNIIVDNSTIDFDCLIDSFEYKEQDGSGDVYFTINLTEYRDINEAKFLDLLTKNKTRKSALQKAANDVSYSMSKNHSLMHSVKKAFKKSVKNSGSSYLADYKKIVKSGGIKENDSLVITNKDISINNKKM